MNTIMRNTKYILITILLIIFVININTVIISVKEASILFFNKIFISIFPFVILSDILIYYDYHIFLKNTIGKIFSKIFNIDASATIVFILSLLTSAPSNAIYIKNMLDNNEINIKTANKLINYTYFPSISFVIGTIGISIYNNFKFGLYLWICVLLYNILLGIILRGKENIKININLIKKDKPDFFTMLKKSIIKGLDTSFIIFGNIVLFTIIINFIKLIVPKNNLFLCLIIGIIEITNGIINVSLLKTNIYLKFCLTLFILTFSSLSIIFQSKSILSEYNFNIKKILITKLVSSLLLLCLICLHYIPWTN